MVTTCFRPTPTRPLHLGSIWNAFQNWRLARACGGEFIMVIDDLCYELGVAWCSGYSAEDMAAEYEDDLAWFGMKPDRVEWSLTNHERHLWACQKLWPSREGADGWERRWYPKTGRIPRWAMPQRPHWDPDNFGDRPDVTITPGDGDPGLFSPAFYAPYMAACLVDDHDFGVTAWCAGRDLLFARAWCEETYWRLGFTTPGIHFHRTVKWSLEEEKMSKSNVRERWVRNYREAGYDPDSIIETILEANVRSWHAGQEQIIVPAGVLGLDEVVYLPYRNRNMEQQAALELPEAATLEPWRETAAAACRERMREETTIRIAQEARRVHAGSH